MLSKDLPDKGTKSAPDRSKESVKVSTLDCDIITIGVTSKADAHFNLVKSALLRERLLLVLHTQGSHDPTQERGTRGRRPGVGPTPGSNARRPPTPTGTGGLPRGRNTFRSGCQDRRPHERDDFPLGPPRVSSTSPRRTTVSSPSYVPFKHPTDIQTDGRRGRQNCWRTLIRS